MIIIEKVSKLRCIADAGADEGRNKKNPTVTQVRQSLKNSEVKACATALAAVASLSGRNSRLPWGVTVSPRNEIFNPHT
jgi:hypothetical protein